MTKPIIGVKVPCKLLYVIQVKEFLIKCSTSWPYLISEFLVAYMLNKNSLAVKKVRSHKYKRPKTLISSKAKKLNILLRIFLLE